MYYTATEASTGDQCIGVATSSVPTGPYVDANAQPVVCDNGFDTSPTIDDADYGGSIDPDIFTDDAGNSFLLWKSDGNHIGAPTVIWSVPLDANLTGTVGTPTQLLRGADADLAGRHHRRPRHGRDADDDRQRERRHHHGQLLPLLRGQRRGRVDLRHRVGQLSRRPDRRELHRGVGERPPPRHLPRDVGTGRARRLPGAAGLGELRHGRGGLAGHAPSAT